MRSPLDAPYTLANTNKVNAIPGPWPWLCPLLRSCVVALARHSTDILDSSHTLDSAIMAYGTWFLGSKCELEQRLLCPEHINSGCVHNDYSTAAGDLQPTRYPRVPATLPWPVAVVDSTSTSCVGTAFLSPVLPRQCLSVKPAILAFRHLRMPHYGRTITSTHSINNHMKQSTFAMSTTGNC